MRFRILGPLEVLSPEGWTAISAPKWRSLLAVLLLRQGQLIPTETLIDELWGDSPPSTANNLVSIYVHRLKKVIGDTQGKDLLFRAPGYMLRISDQDLDHQVFELLVTDGRGALEGSDAHRAAARRRPTDPVARRTGRSGGRIAPRRDRTAHRGGPGVRPGCARHRGTARA